MEVAIVAVAVIAFFGFREWLRHDRRNMIHRERLTAIEKGVELPPLEQEVRRREVNVQKILLLAGLIWISVGATAYVMLTVLLSYPSNAHLEIPQGVQFAGLGGIAVGVSHLLVFLAGKNKEKR